MGLGRLWAGKVYGTTVGNLFLKIAGEDDALTGTLRVNEAGVGLFVYAIRGSFDGTRFSFTGTPQTEIEGIDFGELAATAVLRPSGNLEGEWETTIGSAGTFMLFPHSHLEPSSQDAPNPEQLHTVRHNFGAIEIDRGDIVAIGRDLQPTSPKDKLSSPWSLEQNSHGT